MVGFDLGPLRHPPAGTERYQRDSFDSGKAVRIPIELFDRTQLPAGHRTRLEISSRRSAFNPNQNTGNPARRHGVEVAHQTIYHDKTRVSSALPVVSTSAVPLAPREPIRHDRPFRSRCHEALRKAIEQHQACTRWYAKPCSHDDGTAGIVASHLIPYALYTPSGFGALMPGAAPLSAASRDDHDGVSVTNRALLTRLARRVLRRVTLARRWRGCAKPTVCSDHEQDGRFWTTSFELTKDSTRISRTICGASGVGSTTPGSPDHADRFLVQLPQPGGERWASGGSPGREASAIRPVPKWGLLLRRFTTWLDASFRFRAYADRATVIRMMRPIHEISHSYIHLNSPSVLVPIANGVYVIPVHAPADDGATSPS